MALVQISLAQLCSLGKIRPSEAEPILTSLGIPLEAREGDALWVEITPNRPDWLSVEGIARSAYSYKSGKPKTYKALRSDVSWHVDPSVRDVRPYVGSAYATGVHMTPEFFASLIQLQEKLHDTLGRGRRKMAIGLHDMSSITPPFTYKTVGREEVRFVPLGRLAPMTCAQILTEHEKGIAYAHLVGERCPLIVDSAGEVLSFPPIINGERTQVGESSRDLLIDCTGLHARTVLTTVNIIAAALADHHGQVHSVQMDGKTYPVFEPTIMPLPLPEARSLLDPKLDAAALSRHLGRMGHLVSGRRVLSPPFRSDLLHAVDLVEDIAISIGYNNFTPVLPDFSSTASFADHSAWHEALLGLGYFEASSWILTSRHVLAKCLLDPSGALSVSNPLTEEFSTLRPWLYPNLVDIFSRSKSEPFPQYLYEAGPVMGAAREKADERGSAQERESEDARENTGISSKESGSSSLPSKSANHSSLKFDEVVHVAAAATHPKASLSESLSHLGGFLSGLGVSHALEERDIPGFIPGRCADILIAGEVAGLVGELHPRVLESFGLEQPVALFELDAKMLGKKK